jgi:alpha-tubulin suppressor-like RCC1 family protein
MTKTMLPRCLIRQRLTLNRHFSSLSNTTKVPVLYKSPQINESNHNDTITLQLFSWGRGASGQLGGGIEEIRLYPAPVANLQLPPSSFTLSPTPGQLVDNNNKKGVTEVGISCGLFHSAILADGHFWMWGKGDGGRLGFGHENPAFLPTLNPFLDSVRSIALGGVHSAAITSLGHIFTWSLLHPFYLFPSIAIFLRDISC